MLLVLFTSAAAAQVPPIESVPKGEDKIAILREGQKAPYAGQLFDPSTALRWGNWLQQYKYRLKWDVQRAQSLCEAETTYRDELLKAEERRALTVEMDLRSRLVASEKERLRVEELLRNPAWYTTRTFGVVTGVVATVGVFALSVWAIDASTR